MADARNAYASRPAFTPACPTITMPGCPPRFGWRAAVVCGEMVRPQQL